MMNFTTNTLIAAHMKLVAIGLLSFGILTGGRVLAVPAPPSISPTGSIVYALVGSDPFTLTASGGEASPPTSAATCPPWNLSGSCTYLWDDNAATAGAALEVDVSAEGDRGTFAVKGVGQMWTDCSGASGGPTETTPASVTVHALTVEFSEDQYDVIDGQLVDIIITVSPFLDESQITDGQLVLTPLPGGTAAASFSSPQRVGSGQLTWRVPIAYWYNHTSSNACPMNPVGQYAMKFTFKLSGQNTEITGPDLNVTGLAPCGSMAGGYAYLDGRYFSGSCDVGSNWNATTKKATSFFIDRGSFVRDVRAAKVVCQPAASQFYDQIVAEENYHIGQLEGTISTSNPLSAFFNAVTFYAARENDTIEVTWTSSTAPTSTQINELKTAAEESLLSSFAGYLNIYEQEQRALADAHMSAVHCQIESAAKNHVGSTYICRLACAYPECVTN